jgi:hypothetical protein
MESLDCKLDSLIGSKIVDVNIGFGGVEIFGKDALSDVEHVELCQAREQVHPFQKVAPG